MPAPVTHGDILATEGQYAARRGADVPQDARLAALIRHLAGIRPDILAPASGPPAPSSPRHAEVRVVAPSPVEPLGRAADHPVDPDIADHLARLRAEARGSHRPGDHWPAHATDAYYARKLRVPPRRRAAHALRRAAPALAPTAAFLAGSLLTLLAAPLLHAA